MAYLLEVYYCDNGATVKRFYDDFNKAKKAYFMAFDNEGRACFPYLYKVTTSGNRWQINDITR